MILKLDIFSPLQLAKLYFDSKFICYYRTYFPYDGKMVPVLARAMERTKNLGIRKFRVGVMVFNSIFNNISVIGGGN